MRVKGFLGLGVWDLGVPPEGFRVYRVYRSMRGFLSGFLSNEAVDSPATSARVYVRTSANRLAMLRECQRKLQQRSLNHITY